MTDWLTPEEREYRFGKLTDGCLCMDAQIRHMGHGLRCPDNPDNRRTVQWFAHAAEADRRLAERDDVIRELAGALRGMDLRIMLNDDEAVRDTKRRARSALARVDALGIGGRS